MAFTEQEKAAEKALRRLDPFLIKKLHPDVRNELYARDMLTWHEQQTAGIRVVPGGLIFILPWMDNSQEGHE